MAMMMLLILITTRMPSSLPPQTEVTATTTIEEGKIKVPFKATFTSGLKEWWEIFLSAKLIFSVYHESYLMMYVTFLVWLTLANQERTQELILPTPCCCYCYCYGCFYCYCYCFVTVYVIVIVIAIVIVIIIVIVTVTTANQDDSWNLHGSWFYQHQDSLHWGIWCLWKRLNCIFVYHPSFISMIPFCMKSSK